MRWCTRDDDWSHKTTISPRVALEQNERVCLSLPSCRYEQQRKDAGFVDEDEDDDGDGPRLSRAAKRRRREEAEAEDPFGDEYGDNSSDEEGEEGEEGGDVEEEGEEADDDA